MAIFGKLSDIKHQINDGDFIIAFNYLINLNNEIYNLKENESIKEMITDDIFVIKQAYKTKNREDCFFESHKKYIDIQYMVKGDEIMDVASIEDLTALNPYDEERDFIKYSSKNGFSSLLIKEKELAIFYPEDAHQPCIKFDESKLIYKAVVKIPVDN
jgi:YhcH/YjgK/YiaL family protein